MQQVVIALGAMLLFFSLFSCQSKVESEEPSFPASEMKIAHLSQGDQSGFNAIRDEFVARNPGYGLSYISGLKGLRKVLEPRVVFIQEGGGTATINDADSSKFSVGDIILLKKGDQMKTDSLFSALVFSVPEEAPENIPAFVRPDWDMNITDTPGGCATETNAYRRILLTWLDKVGPYNYHNINAHRVRIMDSFSHYHPVEGGFDEFYLVQMAMPTAKILTSSKVDLIEAPESLSIEQTENLIQATQLNVGDLVYLPRGTMHRGIGGVLAQVITVPGFIPGSEIGVDHHLKQINEMLSLEEGQQLPYNEAASSAPVIK